MLRYLLGYQTVSLAKSRCRMKVELNQSLVLKLVFSLKPTVITNGKIQRSEPNAVPYIITDSHRDAPVGFGVKVGATKKTYFIQRKVAGKLIKTKVGNVGDFPTIDEARGKARDLVKIAMDTGRNPSSIAAERDAAEITLREAFDNYEKHLRGRKKPATGNTFKVLNKAREKLSTWATRRVRDIKSSEILDRFDEIAEKYRTSAEQTFRWAHVAVEHAIKLESHDAASAKREPTLVHNPFGILKIQQKYRTRVELEEEYAKKGVRNPLSPDDTLGKFLDAVWERRRQPLNRTGCDYLLFTLVFGNRKNESAKVKWRDRLSVEEAEVSSFVDFKERFVLFRDTKNRADHKLPLPPFMTELLRQRHESSSEYPLARRVWVFPARSTRSVSGHYSDSKSLLQGVKDATGIPKLAMHDLRRTFGAFVESLGFPHYSMKRLLNHGFISDPSGFYLSTEWKRLGEYMTRTEEALLRTSPTVYNSLRPIGFPPILDTHGQDRQENNESD